MHDDLNPGASEASKWPEAVFPLEDVRKWVIAALGLSPTTAVRIITVYAAYAEGIDQRVTARLGISETSGTTRELVYKDNRFPLLSASSRVHALLSRTCPGLAPDVLAWEENREIGSCRFIYVPFEGCAASKRDSNLLCETARTLARVQSVVVASGEIETIGLVRATEGEIPTLFDTVFEHIERHAGEWQADEGGKLSNALGIPAADVLGVLSAARRQIASCTEQVAALALVPAIDHGDLHGGNAIVQPDGSALIYDWETATIGFPLFSVERLLVDAWRLDAKPKSNGPWGYVSGTATQALVRNAYLGALGADDISSPVFAAAMPLATVKEMHAEITWANLMGWDNGNPEWTAQLISRLRHHLREWRGG